nr:hypothetical protein [Paenibacillus bovis]
MEKDKPMLEELLAKCTPENRHEDMLSVPVGKEFGSNEYIEKEKLRKALIKQTIHDNYEALERLAKEDKNDDE